MAGGRPRGPPEEVLPTAQTPDKRISACEPEQKRYLPATRYQMTRKGMEGRRDETAGSYQAAVQGAFSAAKSNADIANLAVGDTLDGRKPGQR